MAGGAQAGQFHLFDPGLFEAILVLSPQIEMRMSTYIQQQKLGFRAKNLLAAIEKNLTNLVIIRSKR